MDPDGYPEESELDTIRQWPYTDFDGLLDYVRERWRDADCGYWTEKDGLIFVSTCGWSGNEDLLMAMQQHLFTFWSRRWVASRRGGHFVFRRGGVTANFKRWEWDTEIKD